ncbi:MAG: aminomethyl-transferring glycine dehydrogenase subunit GcvPA [Pirellulales bacterium]|nr:aminomethyl-transferring glycine dehydrogenase subunit GcvPA [Pirellulales bacterium]
MSYFLNNQTDVEAMLAAIGVTSIDELFAGIPSEIRLDRALEFGPALGELELTSHMSRLAAKNANARDQVCFLGAGAYDHFIPSVVDHLASRGEFYTAYTPYQPEASQGTLQAMFEYQTLICQLTGMDVSNASLYDGGSAAAEAVLMAMSSTRRYGRVVTAGSVHPEYRKIVETYLENFETEVVTVETPGGTIDVEELEAAVTDQTACVLVQQPNFFGCIEAVEAIAEVAHKAGALLVVSVDPVSLGVLKRPGEYGADIVIAEGQGLGTPLQFGGPYLGIMACAEKFVRRLPGRIAGQTTDRNGRRCWTLTLQTREQHIRREKATSNICTNQGLLALRTTLHLAALGRTGLAEVANLCLQKSHYAEQRLTAGGRLQPAFDRPFFKEFAVRDTKGDAEGLIADALDDGLLAGVPLGRWYPEMQDCFLVAVTEKRTKDEIDRMTGCLAGVDEGAVVHA